ncbi:MAG: dTDP-4-dehydrorhamnose 3,5-epimerase family protein [candidate division WOR-3 bacterium]|nr:dTDP-4-dehydrorhamnose 3,5-epimerase family protein [candidate division WOR-3 bacterium]MDH7519471.1 dTDP-4-dehydrorhamnose 3,5-epimerase family protein [bacterium]
MNSPFQELAIKGVFFAPALINTDGRGWLCETFRQDWFETANLTELNPVMGYVSFTNPGAIRGPHEHRYQTDVFAFLGPSDFLVFLWDNRQNSPTFQNQLKLTLGASQPALLIVPPGVVHGYKNIGSVPGLVINTPNRLYRGRNRSEPVDEIRHEDNPDSPFKID